VAKSTTSYHPCTMTDTEEAKLSKEIAQLEAELERARLESQLKHLQAQLCEAEAEREETEREVIEEWEDDEEYEEIEEEYDEDYEEIYVRFSTTVALLHIIGVVASFGSLTSRRPFPIRSGGRRRVRGGRVRRDGRRDYRREGASNAKTNNAEASSNEPRSL